MPGGIIDQKSTRLSGRKIIRRLLCFAGSLVVILLLAFLIYFPGRQSLIAFTLATGLGVSNLQIQVDRLEEKAIKGDSFSDKEKNFLQDLYHCFAKGGRLITPESSKMMRRYLSGTGESLVVKPSLFTRSAPVKKVMQELIQQISAEIRSKTVKAVYASNSFYMGDPKYFDSYVGLYFGKLTVRVSDVSLNSARLHWRAEVPWEWPSYKSIFEKYGVYHAQRFPLPNARSFIQGSKYCLYMEDGLGGHLATIGLAKPFLAYSEWEQSVTLPR